MNLGIIGTNFISDRLCTTMARVPDVQATAVLSRTREKAEAFAAAHPGMTPFWEREAFFRADIDAVYVATPNVCHYPDAMQALEAGKHVLLEKPAVSNAGEWTALAEKARQKGLVVLEDMRPLYDPAWQTIRAALAEIGPVREVSLRYCQYSSRYDAFLSGKVLNAFNPALSNAAVMDIGSYPVAVMCHLFGAPEQVGAASVLLPGGFEGAGQMVCRYPAFTVHVAYSKITQDVTPSFFLGEKGSITVDKLSSPVQVRLQMRSGEERLLPSREEDNNMDYELAAFAALCRTGQADHPGLVTTANTMAVLDEVRRQAGVVFPADRA